MAYHTFGAPSWRTLMAERSRSSMCQLKKDLQAPIKRKEVLSPMIFSVTAVEKKDLSFSSSHSPEV